MKKIFSLTLLFSTLSTALFSQVVNDAGLWATFNLNKQLNNKFSLFITEEFRLRENFSRVNLFYTDMGFEYRPAKFLRIAPSYRIIQKGQLDGSYSYRHRISLDIVLRKKFDMIILSYRHRLQREVRDIRSSEDGFLPEWYSRSKVTMKFDLGKKISPYISAEYRYQIRNPRMVENDGLWHRQRYIAGFDYEVNKKNILGLYYLIQREFNVSSPQGLYIIGLEYTIAL
jgi:hypothetical protein